MKDSEDIIGLLEEYLALTGDDLFQQELSPSWAEAKKQALKELNEEHANLENDNVIHVDFSQPALLTFGMSAAACSKDNEKPKPWYIQEKYYIDDHTELTDQEAHKGSLELTIMVESDSTYISIMLEPFGGTPESIDFMKRMLRDKENQAISFGLYMGEERLATLKGEVNEDATYLFGDGEVVQHVATSDAPLEIRPHNE